MIFYVVMHSAKKRARTDHSKGRSALSLTPVEIQVELEFIPNKILAGGLNPALLMNG
jgi:hypothetical protein